MFEKDKIAIGISQTNIKIMVGNRNIVKFQDIIKTPEGSFNDDKVVELEDIKNTLQTYIKSKDIKTKKVCFSINGQDIVIRHTEVPLMDEEGIRSSIQWEMEQYLPKNVGEYTIDYEIIERIDTAEKKVLKLLVVAVPEEKVNKYVKLSEMLNLEIDAIDIAANCACRVFRDVCKKEKDVESIGVIDVGSNNTNIIILDKGKLFIEREIPFGVKNIIKEIIKSENMAPDEAFEYLKNNVNLIGDSEGTEVEKRILTQFDNVFSSLEKIVKFFTIGKVKNNLDVMYLIGIGASIPGLKEYTNNYFNCPVNILENGESIGLKIKLPENCNIKQYIGTLGLLLRKE